LSYSSAGEEERCACGKPTQWLKLVFFQRI
jgi:hypothetical protein